MIDLQALGDQPMLQLHHVRVAVFREAHAQAVARLARLPVADVVGQDEEVVRRRRAAGRRRTARRRTAARGTARRVPPVPCRISTALRDAALRVLARRAERAVVQPHLVELFTRREREVADDGVVSPSTPACAGGAWARSGGRAHEYAGQQTTRVPEGDRLRRHPPIIAELRAGLLRFGPALTTPSGRRAVQPPWHACKGRV